MARKQNSLPTERSGVAENTKLLDTPRYGCFNAGVPLFTKRCCCVDETIDPVGVARQRQKAGMLTGQI